MFDIKKYIKNTSIICLFVYAICLVLFFVQSLSNKKYDNWTECSAVIEDLWTEKEYYSDSYTTEYWHRFKYVVDGKEYINETKGKNISAKYNNSKDETIGKNVVILYNGENPSESIIKDDIWSIKEMFIIYFGSATMGNLFVAVGYYFISTDNKKREKSKN